MDKQTFLAALRARLSGLPAAELEASVTYYAECIDDRTEAGESETDAVAAMGPVEEAAAQILSDVPLNKIVFEKVKPQRAMRPWEIVLIVLGSPVWLPILAACVCILLSVLLVIWSLVVALVALEISFAVAAPAGIVGAALFAAQHHSPQALLLAGVGVFCVGAALFGFYGCTAAIRGTARLSGKTALWVKFLFVGRRHSA